MDEENSPLTNEKKGTDNREKEKEEWLSKDDNKEVKEDKEEKKHDIDDIVQKDGQYKITVTEGTCERNGCENISATFSQITTNLKRVGLYYDGCVYIQCIDETDGKKHNMVECKSIPENKKNKKFCGYVYGINDKLFCIYHFNGVIFKLRPDIEFDPRLKNKKKKSTYYH